MDGALRMQLLINDLLRYARVGRGKAAETSCCAEQALDEALKNVAVAMEEAGTLVTRDPLPSVEVERSQVVQLLQNLLGNAIKFRSERPHEVHVSADRDGEMWRFKVQDNGIGMEQSDAERIFVVFKRMHTTAEYEGTGIGLAICKKIVDLNGGKIWVDGVPGEGCAFYFTLPAA